MPRDVLIHEAAKDRLRPFALVGARRAVRLHGLAALDDPRLVAKFIETATVAALNGMLPDAGTMSRKELEAALVDLYEPKFSGLNELNGNPFKKLKEEIKRIGSQIDDGAHKLGSKIDDVNRKIIKKVVIPITAPTISHNMDAREKYKNAALQEYNKWIASGQTDQQAYDNYLGYKAAADKRLDKIQNTVKAAAAVVSAYAVAPAMAAKLGIGAGGAGAGALLAEGATSAAGAAAVDAIVSELSPEAEETLTEYQETAAELQAEEAPDSSSSLLTWLLPVAAAAATVALTS